MAAHLQLIRQPVVVPPPSLPLAGYREPRVFTASFQEHLAQLNHAERELRSMGLHVVWTQLAGSKPQAHILRDADVSIARLLDRMGPRSFREDSGCKVASGDFEGVIVSWVEPS